MADVKETAALKGNETLDPKEELKRLMDQLKQLTDSGEGRKKLSKELNDGVSNFLKTHQDIVGTVKDIYVSLDPKAKEGLENLMKLAKVTEEVRDEQREINVNLEALKQEAVLKETQKDTADLQAAILTELETKISTLISKGKYQEALDNSVFLLTEKNKGTAFRIIKNILQHAPRGVTLYIKDKKITSSERATWIKKMNDNMEAAAREGSVSFYGDSTISGVDEWTLDETKASKKSKEKKAIKEISKEVLDDKKLYKLSKRLNMPSALNLIESNLSKIKELFSSTMSLHPDDNDAAEAAFRDELSKQFFIDNKYITKSGLDLASSKKPDDLSDKEHKALQDMCIYRMTVDTLEDKHAQDAYKAFVKAEISGVAVGELNQSRTILDQVKVDELDPNGKQSQNILMTLLGDLNWDGRLTNTSAVKEGKDREGLDKGTLFGGQMASMFEGAVKRFGAAKVVGNIESVIQSLNGLKEFKVGDPKTIVGLIKAFKANPSALIAFRGKLVNEPDSGMSMFNVGTEYVNKKIDRVKAEEKFRDQCQEFFKTPDGENLLNSLNDKIDEKVILQIKQYVLPNLIEFRGKIGDNGEIKETKAYSKLSGEQKKHINALIELFSSDEGIKEFLSAGEVREMYKNFIISGVGVNFSAINVDGEHIFGAGAQAGITNEKFNAWLSKSTANIISRASSSVGLYCTDGNVSIGLGLGFGSTKNLGDNARAFYNVGGSWTPFNPKGLSFSSVVGAETRVNPSADDALDLKASHYIGVAGAYGIGLNLSDSNFNMNNVSAGVYWKKDKLEGVERNADKIKEKMVPIFQELFRIDGEITPELIMEKLRGGTMNNGEKYNGFAKSSGEALYSTATAIYNMFVSYKGKLKLDANAPEDEQKLNDAVIKKMSEDFADNLARATRNKNIEKIVDEGTYLSGVNVGVTWSFARLFTGFFVSGGLSFTYYEDAKYNENQNMLDIARDGMNNENNFEIITNEEGSYQRKMEIINDMLKGDYLKYYPEVNNTTTGEVMSSSYITLSKETFSKDIKVLCNPELAPYIIQKDGMIKLPGNADVSLAKIMHQGKAEYTLILGGSSAFNCEEVGFDKEKGLKWNAESDVVFGSKEAEFDKYNTTITTKIESMKVGLDGKPNDKLREYLENNGDALVKFRLSNANYNEFIKAVKKDKERGSDFVANTIKYLPDELKTLVSTDNDQAKHDVRFIYASLSRVSQTRDKQLSGEALKSKADEYLSGLSLSAENKKTLAEYIAKVQGGKALADDEWSKMKSILNINYNNWEYKTSNSKAERLFHLLTPVKKLAEHRTRSYERRINSEYSTLGGGADVLIAARNESLKKLEGKPTANGNLQEGWIGAVAGYEDRNSITDKFVSSPKIISGSEYIIPESDNLKLVKKHFLEELSRDDAAQFNHIKERIISTLEKSNKREDKELAQRWQSLADAEFINAILNELAKDANGKDVPRVSFNMQYGFFADCVNETILLGDINVVTTTEQQVQAPHDVHYYDAVVTNDAVTTAHSLSIGGTYGNFDSKTDHQGTNPEGGAKTETKPLADIEGLKDNKNIESVDFDSQEFVWNDPDTGTKRYMMYAYDSDLGAFVAYDFDDQTNPSWIIAVDGSLIRSENWVPSNLGNATEVPMSEPDISSETTSKLSAEAINLLHLGHLMLHETNLHQKEEIKRQIKTARDVYKKSGASKKH